MITEGSGRALNIWGVPAALGGTGVLLMLGGARWRQALQYDRGGIAAGQWWRLASGNLVHLSWWHLLFNLLSLVLLVLLCPQRLSLGAWLGRLGVIGIGMSLGLYWFAPGVLNYVGLSGLVYGLFALGFGRQAWQRDELGLACLGFILARIGWELTMGASAAEARLIGGSVVPQAHLYGVAAAAIYALGAGAPGMLSKLRLRLRGRYIGDQNQ